MAAKKKQASKKKAQKTMTEKETAKTKLTKKPNSSNSANKSGKSFPIVGIGASAGGLEVSQLKAIQEKNRLQAVLAALPVGVSIVDEKGGNPQANKMFERIWGGPPPPAQSIRDYAKYKAWWVDTGKPVKPEEWASAQAVKNGKTVTGQLFEIERFDGSRAHVLNSAAPILDSNGKIIGSAVTILDITEQRKIEDALRNERNFSNTVLNTAGALVVVLDKQGRISRFNRECEKITGYTSSDVLGRIFWEFLIPEEEMDDVKQTWEALQAGGFPNTHENHWTAKDGTKRLIAWTNTAITGPEEEIEYIIATGLDITERKEFEQMLQAANKSLVLAQQSAGAGIWDWDMTTDKLNWSLELFSLFGLDPFRTDASFDLWQKIIHPEDRQTASDRIKSAIQNHQQLNSESRVILPDGEVRWINALGNTAYDEQGNALRMSGICIDITDRKQNEEKIHNLARFPEENPFPVLRLSGDGTIIYSNGPGQVLLEQWNCNVNQKAPQQWQQLAEKSLRSGRTLVEKVKCSSKIFSFAITPVPRGGYVNLYGRDITVQEQIKEVLRQSRDELEVKVRQRTAELNKTVSALQAEIAERISAETKLKERTRDLDAFFSNTITPLVILDKKFNFVRVNQAYADSGQRDISEFAGHNHFEFYPNEENERIFKEVVRTKKPYQATAKPFTYPDHPEWGTTYWDWTLSPIIGENGRVESLVFSLIDVTKRKLAEIALQDSEEKYRSLIEFSPEAVCVLVEEKIAFVNTAALKLLKAKNAQDVVGRSMWDFISLDSTQMARSDMKEILEQHHKISPRELKLSCHDGSPIEVETSATSVFHQGKPGILVLFHDITERKSAEARMDVTNSLLGLFAQKTSRQEYLDSVVEIIRSWSGCRCIGIRLTNTDGFIPYESCAGFSEEFLSLENNLCLKTDTCVCIRAISQTPGPQDAPLLTAKGSFLSNNSLEFVKSLPEKAKKQYRGQCIRFGFVSLAVIPLRYRDKIIGAIHLADEGMNKAPLKNVEFLEDMAALIGEAVHRFNVEYALRLHEKRLLEAQKLAHLGNWEWDIPANRLWWSDEVYHIFGLEPFLFGITYDVFLSYIHPDDRKFVEESINKSLSEGKEYNIDYRLIRPDGTERIILVKAEVTYDANHKPIKMAGTVYDITEQKQAENEIRENQQALRTLAAELQLAEERERRRIAQDLHDSIGQILAFSGRELRSMQKSLPEQTAKSIEEITNQLDTAVEQSRTLSFDLSPSTLYDLGFEVAVEDLVDRTSKTRNIRCYFENCRSAKPLADDVKILLYRSVRELLINAVKHANAGFIKVSLLRSSSDIYIRVEDDGRGFDASILESSSTKSKGFGIFSIRERLSHIGGRLKIESAEGKGTKATLIAPLDIERQEQEIPL
jgi:PAS domain S-box-containing protein